MDNNPFRNAKDEKAELVKSFKDLDLHRSYEPPFEPPPSYIQAPQDFPISVGSSQDRGFPQSSPAGHYPSRPQGVEAASYLASQPFPGQYSGSSDPARPSPSSSLLGRITSSFGNDRNPLDPPPVAFTRAVSQNVDLRPFSPLSLISLENNLSGGFPRLPPASSVQMPYHPFGTHDIPEADWLR